VSFLLKNNFRFDLPFSDGVTYLSRKEEAQIRASWAARDAERVALEDMVLKVDDKPLIDHIHLSVQNWLSQPLVEREDYLNIPHTTEEKPRVKHLPAALNRYQIRLTHQIIRKDYTDLKTIGRDGFVRITIRNENEDAEQKLRQERYREQDIIQAIEFRWVIEALCGGDISKIPERCLLAAISGDMKPKDDAGPYRRFVDDLQLKLSTRRRVLFGHNCFTDLIYLYACFIGEPPEKVEDFQELIHGLFPAVVDTKYLASLVNKLKFNSNLQTLEKEMRVEEGPPIQVPTAFDRYVYGEHFHEAGFDSFMTAKIAVKLSAKLEREEKLRETRKPQKIVKAGETILMDSTADTEDEEQTEEYVTASESIETESVMSTLASKLSGVFSASADPSNTISQPFAGRKMSGTDLLAKTDERPANGDVSSLAKVPPEADCIAAEQPYDDFTPHDEDIAPDQSAISTPVVAVKEKIVDWRSPAEVKRNKNALVHNNLFDILDTPVGPTTDLTPSAEHKSTVKPTPEEDEGTKKSDADLLIWSGKEGNEGDREEGGNDGAESPGLPIEIEKPETPMTAKQLEEKTKTMAEKGEMMPRWESESRIWKVIGNRLVVNACEEGVCIL
jgi:hypothetical protein